jgi:hypothetical protein
MRAAAQRRIFSEFVATFGLLAVILGCARSRPAAVPFAVGAYITAAYWFTASTSFANPAVTSHGRYEHFRRHSAGRRVALRCRANCGRLCSPVVHPLAHACSRRKSNAIDRDSVFAPPPSPVPWADCRRFTG